MNLRIEGESREPEVTFRVARVKDLRGVFGCAGDRICLAATLPGGRDVPLVSVNEDGSLGRYSHGSDLEADLRSAGFQVVRGEFGFVQVVMHR